MNNRKETNLANKSKGTPVIKLNSMFKKDKEKGGTIEKLNEFCGYTTAHGFGRLVESKSHVRKAFWVMACLGAFTMFSCQVIWLAQDYISKPVETYIAMKHVKDIDFPVVTICNHNIIRRSEIFSNKSSFLRQYLKDFLNTFKNATSQEKMKREGPPQPQEESHVDDKSLASNYSIQLKSIASASTVQPSGSISVVSKPTPSARSRKRTKGLQKRKKAATTTSSPTITETQGKKKRKDEKQAKDNKEDRLDKQETEEDEQDKDEIVHPLNDFAVMQKRLHVALASWSEEDLSKLGHQFKDMFRDCTFKGRSCNKKNFWTGFWHYTYGNCFSFNQRKGLRAGGPGPGNGLLLEINVEQNEYDGYITKNAGIRVHIGKPGKVPFPYEKGFSVGPGTSTSVGLRKIQIKRVDPFKNGSCMGEEGLAKDNLYRLKYNATYSTTACKESCLSDKQMEMCDCREYRFPKDTSKNERVCDVMNATVAKCLAGVIKKYRRSNLGCTRKCPSPCNEDVFKLTISSSKFPSLAYENIIQEDPKDLRKANIPPDQISSYLLQLNVFFEELNYEVIEEKIGYGLVNFISDIGGNMGMWIGISVLTCAEILELLCIMFHHAMKSFAKQQSKVKPLK